MSAKKRIRKTGTNLFLVAFSNGAIPESLRESFHSAFHNADMQALGLHVARELDSEIRALNPIQQINVVAGTVSMMFQMATAAMTSTGLSERRKMVQIFLDNRAKEKAEEKGEA